MGSKLFNTTDDRLYNIEHTLLALNNQLIDLMQNLYQDHLYVVKEALDVKRLYFTIRITNVHHIFVDHSYEKRSNILLHFLPGNHLPLQYLSL